MQTWPNTLLCGPQCGRARGDRTCRDRLFVSNEKACRPRSGPSCPLRGRQGLSWPPCFEIESISRRFTKYKHPKDSSNALCENLQTSVQTFTTLACKQKPIPQSLLLARRPRERGGATLKTGHLFLKPQRLYTTSVCKLWYKILHRTKKCRKLESESSASQSNKSITGGGVQSKRPILGVPM